METVQISVASNDRYAPYLAVMLRSLMDFSNLDREYCVTILHTDISGANQELLKKMLEANFMLNFIDVKTAMEEYSDLFVSNHIRIETYFRLLLPDLLPHISKILYIDVDVIANVDVGELYDTKIDGYFLAGTRDADIAANYNQIPDDRKYLDSIVAPYSPYDYMQAGVIVMNLEKFRKECNSRKLLDMALSRKWRYHDQDTLNYLCKGKILFVDYAWNFVYDYNEGYRRSREVILHAPEFIYRDYLRAKKCPKMIHFSWTDKPWFSPGVHYGEKWWMIARRTPFYSAIFFKTEMDLAESIKRNAVACACR